MAKDKLGPGKILMVQTSDGQKYKVPWELGRLSQTILERHKNLHFFEEIISLKNEELTEPIFMKSMEWCQIQENNYEVHQGFPFNPKKKWCELDQWEKDFTNIPESEMLSLLVSAHYLKIDGLIKVS